MSSRLPNSVVMGAGIVVGQDPQHKIDGGIEVDRRRISFYRDRRIGNGRKQCCFPRQTGINRVSGRRDTYTLFTRSSEGRGPDTLWSCGREALGSGVQTKGCDQTM